MIKTIDDLRKCYAVRADKEVFELFMDKCEEFGVLWGLGSNPRDNDFGEAVVFNGAYMDRLGHERVSFMEQAGYKRLALSDFKPTRTEYEKVTESIFDLRDEFERGELYHMGYDKDYYLCENVIDLSIAMDIDNCYRKVQKAVDWQDEVHEWQHTRKIGIYTPLELSVNSLIESHPDNFLELCRVALRANGEIE